MNEQFTLDAPLASRMRPKRIEELAGQEKLLGKNGALTLLLQSRKPLSLLLYGPPGCGKTTLARLYAERFDMEYITASAVTSKISEIKEKVDALTRHPLFAKQLLLFIDEIHRFNKAQQDTFLPLIENGSLVLIGATTENPSFSLNNALLSRMRVLQLEPLNPEALSSILARCEAVTPLPLTEEARGELIRMASGDGRHLLNMVEQLHLIAPETPLTMEELSALLEKRRSNYDQHGEFHHQMISALHKAVRGSDGNAALYWLARMLEGGEDGNYIARRMVRMAVEDIGLADPEALKLTVAASEAYRQLGSPEGDLALAEAILYLALSPKSNALYTAFNKARSTAKATHHLPPPKNIINAPTKLMDQMGFGKGYIYEHDLPDAISNQNFFPEDMEKEIFYQPVSRGFEREMQKRLAYFASLKKNL